MTITYMNTVVLVFDMMTGMITPNCTLAKDRVGGILVPLICLRRDASGVDCDGWLCEICRARHFTLW